MLEQAEKMILSTMYVSQIEGKDGFEEIKRKSMLSENSINL